MKKYAISVAVCLLVSALIFGGTGPVWCLIGLFEAWAFGKMSQSTYTLLLWKSTDREGLSYWKSGYRKVSGWITIMVLGPLAIFWMMGRYAQL